MRPLRLTMWAFGPYAGTEVVDFDALGHLGLFVVAGNNGSGKTTIFDALHYALYGTLPGRRATYSRLRSDHAGADAECRVELDFEAAGERWRVERAPKQRRPKRRGHGHTESLARATLYRLEHGHPVAVCNKIGDVDARCRELVGLTGKQFERVALLPQGEFSRLLRDSGKDRRELLRALFSSDVFGDATTILAERAAKAAAADQATNAQITQRLEALAEAVSTLTETTVPPVPGDVRAALASHRSDVLPLLEAQATDRTAERTSAVQSYQQAAQIAERVTRRNIVRAELADHEQLADQHEADVERLRLARAAIPVVNLSTLTAQQRARYDAAASAVAEVRAVATDVLARLGFELDNGHDDPHHALHDRVEAHASQLAARRELRVKVDELDRVIQGLQAAERRAASRRDTLTEQQRVADAQRRRLVAELAQVRDGPDVEQAQRFAAELDALLALRRARNDLDRQHTSLHEQIDQSKPRLDSLQLTVEAAQKAQADELDLHRRAQAEIDRLAELERRCLAAIDHAEARARLLDIRREYAVAIEHADRIWDSFVLGTAGRLGQALIDDEPCPVCGSAQHPAPAIQSAEAAATESEVEQARQAVDALRHQQLALETQLETLLALDPDLAAVAPRDLDTERAAAKSAALLAGERAAENHRVASALPDAAAQLASIRAEIHESTEQLIRLDEQCNQIDAALADSDPEPLEALQDRVREAHEAIARAEQAATRSAELDIEVEAAVQTRETLAVACSEADSELVHCREELAERQAQRAELIGTLGDAAVASVPELDEHIALARRAVARITELDTALAVEAENALGVQRAEAQLAERLDQSPFTEAARAHAAFLESDVVQLLETSTADYSAKSDRLRGQLDELSDLPSAAPDLTASKLAADQAELADARASRALIECRGELDRSERELDQIVADHARLDAADRETQRLTRVAALVKGDNSRNTSLENWVLGAHLRDVVELANVRLGRSTQQRFQLCVRDDGEHRRGTWGLDLAVEDTVTGTQRPTAGLSGGELFQASLALALGLADVVMAESAGVQIDALFIDEGFGSLDDSSVERAIDLLDELRGRGAMVGVITHVPALLDALPLGIVVEARPDGNGSTIRQRPLAA